MSFSKGNESKTKFNPKGKTYISLIGEFCKEKTNGGCWIQTYCILTFSKDSVKVSYSLKANCATKEEEFNYEHLYDKEIWKSYEWKIQNDTLTIENFEKFGVLIFSNGEFVATKNEDSSKALIFEEKKIYNY